MNTSPTPISEDTSDREVITSRTYDAPRELVFEAWTNPEHLVHWWGPDGFTLTTKSADIRPGGTWKFIMHGPDGTDYPNVIIYDEIVKPERISYSHAAEEGEPPHFHTVVTFVGQGDQTHVTMRGIFPSAEALQFVIREHNAIEGGKQTMGRLVEYLKKM